MARLGVCGLRAREGKRERERERERLFERETEHLWLRQLTHGIGGRDPPLARE